MDQKINLQPVLSNDLVMIRPIRESDFEELFRVGSDPLIWEQHPNRERYKKEQFEIFFRGAIDSHGGFVVFDCATNEMIGSTRFYDYREPESSIIIGFTFLARDHWGGKYNQALKKLMLDYIFQSVNRVIFQIGQNNIRSQKAIERIGAVKVGEAKIPSAGEQNNVNFIYCLEKRKWQQGI